MAIDGPWNADRASLGTLLPARRSVVRERMPLLPLSESATAQRAARLEARLSLYAQYAALVGEEVASAWSGEPGQAGAQTRELARERAELAERYAALQGWPEGAPPPAPDEFPHVLADAVTELDHQADVERALRRRLDALRESGAVGHSALPSADPAPLALPAGDAAPGTGLVVAEPGAADGDPTEGDAAEGALVAPDAGAPAPIAVPDELGGALVAARSSGVGGILGGQYPGVAAGADAAVYACIAVPDDAAAPAVRVDVKF